MKFLLGVFAANLFSLAVGSLNTAERVMSYGYPAETHIVKTSDGYNLKVFRIPFSPNLQNQSKDRPVIFLQHGLLSSSDCWILNGPENALAYLLSDAGFDVWMGNARGNTYSKSHSKMLSTQKDFWDFSWHEIALYDMPAMIDYVLKETKQKSLHYVGHSQGTTVFFVLMSQIPSYNAKIKTSHMLAPVAYMKHMKSGLAQVLGPIFGSPILLTRLIGDGEIMAHSDLLEMLGSLACSEKSAIQPVCTNLLFLLVGSYSYSDGWKHLNNTLMEDVVETHPAGSSTKQVIHYLQEFKSGYFRQYEKPLIAQIFNFNQGPPPSYEIKNVVAPVRLYYSDNDKFASVEDVLKLSELLPNLAQSFHVPYPDWNHLDFLWGMEVKDVLYDRIIRAASYYEKTGKQLH